MRYIGIRPRTKRTADGEARPTQVVILSEGVQVAAVVELPDETAELDFVKGAFPTKLRKVNPGEDLSVFAPHHVLYRGVPATDDVSTFAQKDLRFRKLKKTETEGDFHPSQLDHRNGTAFVVDEAPYQVPASYEGLQHGDTVAMILGGSGDNMAYALARRGETTSAKVLRIPPFLMDGLRNGVPKKQDAARWLAWRKPDPSSY